MPRNHRSKGDLAVARMPTKQDIKLSGILETLTKVADVLPFVPGAPLVSRVGKPAAGILKGLNMSNAKTPGQFIDRPTKLAQRPAAPAVVASTPPTTYNRSVKAQHNDGYRLQVCEAFIPTIPVTDANGFATTTAAATTSWITPRNTTLFPWLSTIAASNFTKFIFKKVKVWFQTTQGTTTDWQFWFAYIPDPDCGPPTSAADVLALSQKQLDVGWHNFQFQCKLLDEGNTPFYIDSDGQDNRLEIQGSLFQGLIGAAPSAVAASTGTVFIEYDVELYDRKLSTVTLLAHEMHLALLNRRLSEEARRRAGLLFIEEVLRCRPPVAPKIDALEKLTSRIMELTPDPPQVKSFALRPSAPSTAFIGGM